MWGREAFRIWAPDHSEWSPWVKPTLFAQKPAIAIAGLSDAGTTVDLNDLAVWPPAQRLPEFDSTLAVVVDMPGQTGVRAAWHLAERGWRPVPLYNATLGPKAEVPQETLLQGLQQMTAGLERIPLPDDAPPAFLLDARRKGSSQRPSPGSFDNRWLVFPQDFPSATRLLASGVTQAVVLTEGPTALAEDLCHVLRRWQEGGLVILRDDLEVGGRPEPVTVPRPSRFRNLFYVALAMFGLYRNSAGGFGAIVPMPGSG
jgi:hypothetical protein